MQLLREAMEGVLAPDLVARAIFDALGEYGGHLPQRGRELKTFVEGPLSRTLARRVDDELRQSILDRLRPIVEAIIQSEIPPPSPSIRSVRIPATAPMGLTDAPTERRLMSSIPYVLIVSAGKAMETRLKMALGETLGVSTARGAVDVHAAILAKSPRLLLVDATDPVDVPMRDLTRALARACPDSLICVWGATRPFGEKLLTTMAVAVPPPIGLEEAEGVEPLVDLVRSHGMGEPPRPEGERLGPLDLTPPYGTHLDLPPRKR